MNDYDRWRVHQRWCDPTQQPSNVCAVEGTLSATGLSYTVAAPNVKGTVDGTSLQMDSPSNLIVNFGGRGRDASPTRTPQRATSNVFTARMIWHSSEPILPH